jgi:hypothetical protein
VVATDRMAAAVSSTAVAEEAVYRMAVAEDRLPEEGRMAAPGVARK